MFKKIIVTLLIGGLIVYGAVWVYNTFLKMKPPELFTTETVQKRNIEQSIKATGYLETAQDIMKIGSIVPGVVRRMYVEENDKVQKGQLLAEIDDGKDDNEVRSTQSELERAKALLAYLESHYKRQKVLFEGTHISKNEYEKNLQDYHVAKADVHFKQAQHDQAVLTYNNKKIVAPESGLVISKISREGETVTLASPPTLIYTIAHDIQKLKARPNIDESTIGDLKKGTKAVMTFDTYPYKTFQGILTDISNSSVNTNGAITYLGTIPIDNKEELLKPGMSVNVEFLIAKKKNVIAIPGYVFKLNVNQLKQIAQIKKYKLIELPPEQKDTIKENVKSVWILEKNAIIEKLVTLGISDNAFHEVVSGLQEGEKIITDITEPDIMEQYYSRMFGGGLQGS